MSSEDPSTLDPFVTLLEWIVSRAGGPSAVVSGLAVSDDTLNSWRKGAYPRQRASAAVTALEKWAREELPDYPPAWAPPGGLADLAGPNPVHVVIPVRQPYGAALSASQGNHSETTSPATASAPDAETEVAAPAIAQPDERGRSRARRVAVIALATIVLAVGVAAAVVLARRPSPSSATYVYAPNGLTVPVRSCPTVTCQAKASLETGTAIVMICFQDTVSVAVNYSSPRWFNVRVPATGATGWVHSSQVSHQTHVGLC